MTLGFLAHPCKMLAAGVKDRGKAAGPVRVRKIAVEFYFRFTELAIDSPPGQGE